MSDSPHVLMIAPFAPPRNAAEAIQVRRILAELDGKATGHLVTVQPDAAGWAKQDASLALELQHFDTQILTLPWHRFTGRIVMSHRMARLHVPDAYAWTMLMAGRVLRALQRKPDVIYSRSYPISAALLARKLKRKLGIPWIMHLSDPWAQNPYGTPHPRDEIQEAACFKEAALIALTTHGQAQHYRSKYPGFADKIIVSPNVMPDPQEMRGWLKDAALSTADDRLRIVFAGNLYGDRSPQSLVNALHLLRSKNPEILQQLHIDFYGHAQESALHQLRLAPEVIQIHGPVSYREAHAAQQAADIVLSIEPETGHALSTSFLPSKVVDCLALGKPLLAITPHGSETAAICAEGYGWAVVPSQPEVLAARIAELAGMKHELRHTPAKSTPPRYSAQTVVNDLLIHMNQLRHQQGL